jgi:hypothetical protein
MTLFSLGEIRNASVWSIYRMRDQIDMNPVYQRESDIWTPEKRQLLIDTIINGFDVPKIYMHKFTEPQPANGTRYEFAVIDGKQRLSTMWSFIQGRFALPSDFSYVKDDSLKLAGLTYGDIARDFPDIKADFDSYKIDVVTIETNETELIEDMFSRLNEAMPLNAAEKRNARPGPLPAAVRSLAAKGLFSAKLPFSNRRYRHLDLAAKMLLLVSRDTIGDTKKAYIDRFFEKHANSSPHAIADIVSKATAVADAMESVFIDKDPLLRSAGMVILYFLVFERAIAKNIQSSVTRPVLMEFEEQRRGNREKAEANLAEADYSLIEFDRYTQSPNDGIALRYRLGVMDRLVFEGRLGFDHLDFGNLELDIPGGLILGN